MASVSFRVASQGFPPMIAFTDPGGFLKATRGALRYAGAGGRTRAGQSIAGRYGIPSGRIKTDISKPISQGNDTLILQFARKSPPTLRAYGAKPVAGGISAAIFKGQRSTIAGAFFVRFSGAPSPGVPVVRTGSGRSDLKALYGPSIGSIFGGRSRYGDEIRGEVNRRIEEQFLKGFEREISRRGRGF